ncbi:MAG: porin [Flavobacteriaceae bacterium]|nr:porin [Flavobacteriaceae bacterium]
MKNKFYTLVVALFLYSIGIHAQEVKNDTVRINQYGQKVNALLLDAESQDGFINFTSKDGSYRLWMDNRVQFDGAVFSTDTYNEIGNGVNIRRARFAVKAQFWNNWYGEIDVDFAGAVMEMKDMYIKYTADSNKWNIKAGHFKEGFGMETTTTSRYLTFMERSLVSKMDASRSLGVQTNIMGSKYLLIGGVHFNAQGEYEEVEFSQDQNKDFGIDEGYSFTGRAVWAPILDAEKVLHLGIAGTYRTPKTHLEDVNTYRYSTRSHTSINRKKYLDTDDIKDVESTTGFNFELAGKFKSFMFQGEYKMANVSRMNGLESYSADGFYIQAAYLLFGGHHNYNMREGEFTRITRGRDKGDLELAFRYDYVNLNDFDAEIYGGSAEGYTLGLNYHFNPNVKFMANYVYNNHDRFANGKGKLYVGHDANGDLTKDPFQVVEAKGKGGDDFGMVSFRIEVNF